MKLVIMRHGQASWSAACDSERSLTRQGVGEITSTATALAKQLGSEKVERIFTSPYRRAQQTATLVREVLMQSGVMSAVNVETLTELIPEGDPIRIIDALPEAKVILLASHMPLVGNLAAALCGDSTPYLFQTGMAVILEMEFTAPAMARLIGTISPD